MAPRSCTDPPGAGQHGVNTLAGEGFRRHPGIMQGIGAAAKPCLRFRRRPAESSSASPSRALAMAPEVILFDEPTSAPDPKPVGETRRPGVCSTQRRTPVLSPGCP